jgi:hypothetical protein
MNVEVLWQKMRKRETLRPPSDPKRRKVQHQFWVNLGGIANQPDGEWLTLATRFSHLV